ncbi:UNVERIFIED_CONTAM: release factor H-coupled RctB family protein [Acetivibrio alkalicellulosi]
MNKVTIISSTNNWMEQNAIDQINQISKLPGVVRAVGLPDLHPGKTPVGAAIITENVIYPHLVGNDIGCGMSMFMTDIKKRKIKIDRMIKKLEVIENLREIPLPKENDLNKYFSLLGSNLGTIGGGNHFAELQEVDTVFDEELFINLGFDKNNIMLLIHSGSRGYGQSILDESIKVYSAQNGLLHSSEAAINYLSSHDNAVNLASVNRDLIAYKILKSLGVEASVPKLLDCSHNFVSIKEWDNKLFYIHRKGAAPADKGPVIIPGSRGSLSYLVMPTDNVEVAGFSLAHGSGRKWERSMCRARLESKYTKESIKSTKLKGRVICNDTKLLFEEASEAYKNIDTVIRSLVDFELVKVISTFKPILTYKN